MRPALAVFSRVALCTGLPRIQCFSLSFSFGYTRPVRLRAFWCWPSSLFATMYLSDRVLTLIHGFSKPKTTVCVPRTLTKGERAFQLFGYVAPRGPLRGFGVGRNLLTSGRRAIYKPSNYAFPSTKGEGVPGGGGHEEARSRPALTHPLSELAQFKTLLSFR